MKRLVFIGFILFFTVETLYTSEEKIRLALHSFDDSLTLAAENVRAGSVVTSALEKKYSGVDWFQVRDKNAIKYYLDCITRVQLGLSEPDVLTTSASDLKIDYLTVGTVSRFGDHYEIDARTVNINNWRIVHARGCTMYSISKAVEDLSWYISKQFTVRYLKQREVDDIKRPSISVLRFKDFNDAALRTGYSGAFAEILNSELGSYFLITTIERTYTKALVNEKMLEMAGVIENDGSDESFNLTGIRYKLTGDIRVYDDLICLSYSVYDTSDGRVVHMGIREIASYRGLRPAARDIALTVEDLLNNRIGTLKIESEPSGAEVLVNGVQVGNTPLVTVVAKGNCGLMVRSLGYETHKETFDVKAQDVVLKNIKLEPLSMKLMNMAFKLEKHEKWEEAVKTYEKFIEAYGDNEAVNNALYRKGHVEMINLKQYDEALKTFRALVGRYPETMVRAEAYYGLARTHYLLGNKEEAKKTLDYILEKYSDTYAAEEARKIRERL